MYIITLKINTNEDIQGIKESIAMDMEKYGDVEIVEVKEDEEMEVVMMED